MTNTKKIDSYSNDDKMFFINKWFETHETLSKENFEMLTEMVYYMRTDSRATQSRVERLKK